MDLYKIIGLTLTTFIGNSYETESNNLILHDETGKGITKPNIFTKYILYVVFENTYYALHLSEQHCASGGGRLCCCGNMEITQSSYEDIMPVITHLPITQLVVPAAFEVKSYDYDDDICVCVNEDPDTCVFEFSLVGNNEVRPCGFVYVNMNLFHNL